MRCHMMPLQCRSTQLNPPFRSRQPPAYLKQYHYPTLSHVVKLVQSDSKPAPLSVSFQRGGRSLRASLVLGPFPLLLLHFVRGFFFFFCVDFAVHLSSLSAAFWFSNSATAFLDVVSSSSVVYFATTAAAFR
ncbi:hypothetical protein LWI28_025164 [Acer negundo]|uniref:Transmembrane protein n=1 Tax=Acer negundo TaxID=4023 RepID=A0AAD5JBC2_ACENE|nr:hypothetical protein LWI28_025164 [Acer negundo]